MNSPLKTFPRRLAVLAVLAALAWLTATLALGGFVVTAWASTTGSGQQVTEQRQVSSFDRVSMAGDMTVLVSQGDRHLVQVKADDNLQALLLTEVDGGQLRIRWKRGESVYRTGKVVVTVVTPQLTGLAVAGSGDLQLAAFNTPSLKLTVAGSGDAKLTQLSTDELSVSVAGSGDVRGSGQAARVVVSIAGSGDVLLREMKADDVSVRIAGSGDAAVHAEKTLKVSIAGSGDVAYSGPAVVTRSIAGSGNIVQR